ncbi:unnamed protein product [Urochloa decumbens]|uniref:Uncharacterized protein n=1 Tax=Urochloa decumbens TaxID=240449 RepID=A0ABC9B1E6_9POAL
MDVVTGAIGSLISKLGELLKDEYNLQKDLREQVKSLSLELESAQAALRKVGDVAPEQLDEQVRIWAREVRESYYDMEDVLDTFLVERLEGGHDSLLQRLKGGLLNMMGSLLKRRKIAGTIKDIKQHLHDVTERHGRYTIDNIVAQPAARSTIDPRLAAMYKEVTHLIGIDKSRGELKSKLDSKEGSGSNEKTKIVAVVGVGGLGKTTLAKAVYDELKPEFWCGAFVPVGRNPDLKKVLRDILIDLDKEKYRDHKFTMLDEKQLIDELREFLGTTRYFIVIDDVWDTESWEIIRNALDNNSLGSKIVITTRKHDVAEEVGCSYNMEPLTHESSKILFYGRIFGSERECPSQFSEVSEKILKKCGGVPLAIITTSSLLANKSRNIKVWNEVCDSIGSGLGSNRNMENMRKILSLSYYDLPSHLKTCLVYLSIFPEDYEIEKKRLIWRWIAEDFIQHGVNDHDQSLFEIGESYFNELINRSLIEVADTSIKDGTPLSCRVHDMVLELICSLSIQENFVTTVQGDSRQSTPSSGSVRRLSLQKTAWPIMETSKLRSLTIFSSTIINLMPSLSCCHLLRVLDLRDCNLRDHPNLKFLGNLFHLRYLSLAYTGYPGDQLPVEIGKLQVLQTLDLSSIQIIDAQLLSIIIAGLRKLICLCVEGTTRLPNGLRCLTSLEYLKAVNVDSACMAEELGHLTQLRTLYVRLRKDKDRRWDESLCTALVRSLAELHRIQELIVEIPCDVGADLEGSVDLPFLSWDKLSYLRIYGTTSLPTWICPASLPHLSDLNLRMVQVRTDDIRVLGMLQALRLLEVEASDSIQVLERFVVSHDAFPLAIKCSFLDIAMVPSAFPRGAMPSVTEFTFSILLEDFAGGKFTGDDLALGHLPSLQSVFVDLDGDQDVSKEVLMKVVDKLRDEADDHPNHPSIEFNPSIEFRNCI